VAKNYGELAVSVGAASEGLCGLIQDSYLH